MTLRTGWRRAAAFASLLLLSVSPVGAQTWDSILSTIRKRFPTVRQLSTRELSGWMEDAGRPAKPLLLDVRAAREFGVSHLPGARHATSLEAIRPLLSSNSQPIVVYCSVGYRSSALAEKLQKAGITNVYNLDGSIFAWANEGRPVCQGSKILTPALVHPYDEKWGQLLKPELRATPGPRSR